MGTVYPANERLIYSQQHALDSNLCMSTGFKAVEVMSTISKIDISQSVGTRDLNERFGPETVSRTKLDSKSIPSGWCGSHGLITDAVPKSPNLMRVN
jgi:hypothetical protein